MAFVIQVVSECVLQHKYVLLYDTELDDDDTYMLTVVDKIQEAKKFDTVSEALAYCCQNCPNPPKIWYDQKLTYRPLINAINVRFVEV